MLIAGTASCQKHPTSSYYGYIEARLTYLSSPYSGQLIALNTDRGQSVTVNQIIFQLDKQPELSELDQAIAENEQAKEQLADLEVGKRPSEIQSIQEQIDEITADLAFYKKEFQRQSTLIKSGAVSVEKLDQAVRDYNAMKAHLIRLQADLVTAKLPAREHQVSAAMAHAEAGMMHVKQLQWILSQKTGIAPVEGITYDTYYRVGELVPSFHPVLSIMAPKDVKVIFFVPETDLSYLKLTQTIQVTCDSCDESSSAAISFISPEAEYTPPIIYSRSARSKLVYRIEAEFQGGIPATLHPGEPVDIQLNDTQPHEE